MNYFIVFLEGIITFISPCLLPMLPIYVSYFAGDSKEGEYTTTLKNSLGFVLGFTIIFVAMGALAGSLGSLLIKYKSWVDIISGLIVIMFGLSFLGVFKINFLSGIGKSFNANKLGFFRAILFGIIFSVGWTPCVGAFLGSALALASQQGHAGEGVLMLLLYSLGLGIPFIISAVLIDRLRGTFDAIKKHYGTINIVSGVFLIIIGIVMMTGYMTKLLNMLSMP